MEATYIRRILMKELKPSLEGFVVDSVSAVEGVYYQFTTFEKKELQVASLFQDTLNALASIKGGKEYLQEVIRYVAVRWRN